MIQSVRRVPARIGLVLGLVATAACTGENIFSLSTSANALGPTIDITAPPAGATIAAGDSLAVTASVTASAGVETFEYRGRHLSGANAFAPLTFVPISGQTEIEVTKYLQPGAGQIEATAWVVVTVFDAVGASAKDSVSITITP